MTDLFIGPIQLNTTTVSANIISIGIKKNYNNFKEEIYNRNDSFMFPISGGEETYELELILWGRGDIYSELLIKEKEIYDFIKTQIGNLISIKSSDLPIYLNNKSLNVYFKDSHYSKRGTDGKNFITLRFDCLFNYSLDVEYDNTIAGQAIAEFSVAE